jgi:hypothetical protein
VANAAISASLSAVKGNEIAFEPLTYTVSGAKMTEYFTPGFP